MSERYDVFISYRRKGGSAHARNVQQALKRMDLHPFLDFDELENGKFDQRIMDAIEEAPTFLIILTEGALDRCVNEDDWVRKEILYAHQLRKHIIPVEVDKCYHGKTDTIPDSVRDIVGGYQFAPLDTETLFNDCINRLIARIAKDETPKEEISRQSGAEVHFEVDYPCWVSRFGKELLLARPENDDNLTYLRKGKHKLEFKAVDYPNVKESQIVEIPDLDWSDIVEVKMKANVDRERDARGKFTVGGVDFNMIYVEGGTFTMRAIPWRFGEEDDRDKPAHKVTVSDYYIGETMVTQALWKAVMGDNPSFFTADDNRPVEYVSLDDVTQKFIPELNRKTGRTFRLPTEAEWEFAARGGNKSKGYKYSGSDDINEVAWYGGNSNGKTHPVKGKKANELGLYDMSGNVDEWCQDWYGEYGSDPQVNPTGPENGKFIVIRGGNLWADEKFCRVACRFFSIPNALNFSQGFRLVLLPR